MQKKDDVKLFENINNKNIGKIIFQTLNLMLYTFSISFIIASASVALESNIVSANSNLTTNSSVLNLGCCFNEEEGLCDPGTEKTRCEAIKGKFFDDENCNINECRLGCCFLNAETKFVTKKRCEKLSSFINIPLDFSSNIETEENCLNLKINLTETSGACVLDAGAIKTCKFTTANDCKKMTGSYGNFYLGLLCSNPSLETNCKKQIRTGCAEGKDEVYWFDSCGNMENIYDADKDKSWNNGKLLKKEQSCNSNSNNANSPECGNCNYFLGSKCSLYNPSKETKPQFGDYICRDMNCKYQKTEYDNKTNSTGSIEINRKNGESWCVYESSIGNGTDVVGSRHFRYSCIGGEVKTEPCSDYRQQICVENKKNFPAGEYSIAACRTSLWRKCIDSNTGKGPGPCKPESDCHIKHVKIDSAFKFDVCVPKYPSGWDIEDYKPEEAKTQCSMATQTCIVIYVCGKCVVNCKCETEKFAKEMNTLCRSLGDCGAEANIAGKVTTEGYSVKKTKKLSKKSLEELAKLAFPIAGQKAIANVEEILKILGLPLGAENPLAIGKANTTDLGAYLNRDIAEEGGTISMKKPSSSGAKGGGKSNNWLYAFAIVGVIIKLILSSFGKNCKVKKVKVKFNCMPWQAPVGSADCHLCNENPLVPCTKYRCDSLGKACEFKILESGEPYCMSIPDDGKFPAISPWQEFISENLKYNNVNSDGFEIRTIEDKCISPFTTLQFGILTDEKAQCKVDTIANINYDEIEDYFGDDSSYKTNHSIRTYLPSIESANNRLTLENEPTETNETDVFIDETNRTRLYLENLNRTGQINFYIKCQDIFGNKNTKDYKIDICVSKGPDINEPQIVEIEPKNNSYVAYGNVEKNVTIWVNEPSECKWSLEDKNYGQMENEMSCLNDIDDFIDIGWPCIFTMPLKSISESIENKIYIRCKDQPWFENNDSRRNANTKSYEYFLKKTSEILEITKIQPEGKIIRSFEPATITLYATTKGGVDAGNARCEYSFDNETFTIFYDTDSDSHETSINNMKSGIYNLFVKCEDEAENIAYNSTTFEIEIDNSPPIVTRAYYSAGLNIITNEEAVCAYSTQNCLFNFENATKMTLTYSKIHQAEWNRETTYYIKCRDVFGNLPDLCSIIVKPSNLV